MNTIKQTFPDPGHCINCHKAFTPTNKPEAITHTKTATNQWQTGRKCHKCTTTLTTTNSNMAAWDKRYRRHYNSKDIKPKKTPRLKKKLVTWEDVMELMGIKRQRENIFAKAERLKNGK